MRLLCTRSSFSKSVKVSIAVENAYDRVDLCWPYGMKVNGQYYHHVLLSQQMPAIEHVAGDTFVFQQYDLIVSRTSLNCYTAHSKKRWTSLVLISGHQTAQTWIQCWIVRSGVLCSRKCMNVVWAVSMSWSSASLKSGTVCTAGKRYWCSHQRVEKATENVHACRCMDNILNT